MRSSFTHFNWNISIKITRKGSWQYVINIDDSVDVWDRTKEEELLKWGILSNRIELLPGQVHFFGFDAAFELIAYCRLWLCPLICRMWWRKLGLFRKVRLPAQLLPCIPHILLTMLLTLQSLVTLLHRQHTITRILTRRCCILHLLFLPHPPTLRNSHHRLFRLPL